MPTSESNPTGPYHLKVLIADDNELVLAVLKEQLQPEGLDLTTVRNPEQALEALQRDNFSIVLADQEMPGMSGLDFLAKVKESHPSATRLLLTSTLSLRDIFDAIKSEVIHRYVTKPWLREDLLVILRNSVACNLPSPAAAPGAPPEAAAESLGEPGAAGPIEGEPEADAGPFASVHDGDVAVEAFIKSLSIFHPNLGNTAMRARVLCKTVGEAVGLTGEDAQSFIWAGALHDLALIGLDRALVRRWLRSPEKCTVEEMNSIKKHPQDCEELLQAYPVFKGASEIIRCHHETWDGAGYPDRLQGEAIPWLSRLLSVVIYFCSRHQAAPQVLAEIQNQAEKMFDKKAVEAVAGAVPNTELPRGEREILLIELQPGMVVARDIYSASGVLILTKGRELTTAWINKIMNINSATPLNPFVLVYC